MPRKRSFSPFRWWPQIELLTQTSAEHEAAAQRVFRNLSLILVGLTVVAGVLVHFVAGQSWGWAFVVFLIGPAVAIVGYCIDRVLEARMEVLIEGKIARQEREFRSIPTLVSHALSDNVEDIKSSMHFISSYLECTKELDPYERAPRILAELRDKMAKLVTGEFEVEGDEYYTWLKSRLERKRAATVRAISHRKVSNYKTDHRESEFLEANKHAAGARTTITRIFALQDSELADPTTWEELYTGFVCTKMIIHFVFYDELPGECTRWLMGGGLSIYDKEEAFYDKSFLGSPPLVADLKLIPKAAIYFNRHPFFGDLVKAFEDVYELTRDQNPQRVSLRADGNVARFKDLHMRQMARLRAAGADDADERIAMINRSLQGLPPDEPPPTANAASPPPSPSGPTQGIAPVSGEERENLPPSNGGTTAHRDKQTLTPKSP